HTRICDLLGIEFPIFAFSHCRDVVAAVSRAGGFGVFGALAFPPDQLEVELRWIDEHVGGKPYGVDVVMPEMYAGRDAGVLDKATFEGMIPEARGHTGEVATMVLVPEVVDAVHPTPVLAAGGIGCGRQIAAALALGAEGAWTGSIWLTTTESDLHPVAVQKVLRASSRDTVRSRALTGKPARQLRTAWTDAWDAADSPGALPMPLQFMLTVEAVSRIHRYAHVESSGAKELWGTPIGQIVGRMKD